MNKMNMYDNYNLLIDRVLDSLDRTDLLKVKDILKSIDKPTLVSGVGGSFVVSNYASKVLSKKNNIITKNVEPRDINYLDINNYNNVLSCSYSGNNYGVETSFNNNLKHYLLSKNCIDGVENINYKTSIDNEYSFISIAATLIPMSILLSYYLDNDLSIINEILYSENKELDNYKDIYEIITGYESSTSSLFLDSTIVESGIGVPIIHSKYDYCHGRSTLTKYYDSSIILLNKSNELDDLIINSLESVGNKVFAIEKKYQDDIINDYYLTYMCMLICKAIAKNKNMDLYIVDYSPVVKKLYRYNGEM